MIDEIPDNLPVLPFGAGLSVIIVTRPGLDWQTFAAWYSFHKNLPDATVAGVCLRGENAPYPLGQWTKRLGFRYLNVAPTGEGVVASLHAAHKAAEAGLAGDHILVIDPYVLAVGGLTDRVLARLTTSHFDEVEFFVNRPSLAGMLDRIHLQNWVPPVAPGCLYVEAKDAGEPACLVGIRKGVGKWIPTATGCPFSSAGGLFAHGMTANERRVIELWQQMVPLYSAVS